MSTSLSPLLAPMLSSAAMRAVCDDVACLQNMLDFEAALARAEAAVGVIPASAAGPITNACRAESFDLAALAEAATRSGNLAIPLVKALTANVAKSDADAARYVHWGATSQDVIDTGTMLGLRAGIDAVRRSACSGCAMRRWRCNSAAPPARSPPSGPRDCRSRKGWHRNSSCRCPRHPGTPTATALRRRRPCSPSSPAQAARSRAMYS